MMWFYIYKYQQKPKLYDGLQFRSQLLAPMFVYYFSSNLLPNISPKANNSHHISDKCNYKEDILYDSMNQTCRISLYSRPIFAELECHHHNGNKYKYLLFVTDEIVSGHSFFFICERIFSQMKNIMFLFRFALVFNWTGQILQW